MTKINKHAIYILGIITCLKMPQFIKNINNNMRTKIHLILIIIITFFFITNCEKEKEVRSIILPPTSVLQVETLWGVIESPHLRLREKPSYDSRIVRYLTSGFVLEIVSRGNNKETIEGKQDYWYQINYNGVNGWVFGGYLKIFDSKGKALSYSKGFK